MKVTIADDPDFDIYTNGTLVIKMVQLMDDKKMFICKAQKNLIEMTRFATILNIAKGDVYISVIWWW